MKWILKAEVKYCDSEGKRCIGQEVIKKAFDSEADADAALTELKRDPWTHVCWSAIYESID